jgi:hypothetical protein
VEDLVAGKMMMTPLLTTSEVARLLYLSEKTVYAQRQRLDGFYPAGIRALRFRKEDIYAIMEGPQERQLAASISTSGPAPQQDRIQNEGRGPHQHGVETSHPNGEPATQAPDAIDSIIRDAVRFGLRDVLKPGGPDGKVSPAGGKKPGRGKLKKA